MVQVPIFLLEHFRKCVDRLRRTFPLRHLGVIAFTFIEFRRRVLGLVVDRLITPVVLRNLTGCVIFDFEQADSEVVMLVPRRIRFCALD